MVVVTVNVVTITTLLARVNVAKIGFCGSNQEKGEKGESEEKIRVGNYQCFYSKTSTGLF